MGFITSKTVNLFLPFFTFIILNHNNVLVLSLVVSDSETTQQFSVSGADTENPLLNSPDIQNQLSQLFLKCSSECSGLDDCLGITIYQLDGPAEQLVDPMDRFSCVPTINDDANSLHSGKIFYKIMFKDRLPKVQRRKFMVRTSRAIPSGLSPNELPTVSGKRENSPTIEVDPPSATVTTKVEPVKIDPLFTETTTVAGVTVDSKNINLPAGSNDTLFGENQHPATTPTTNSKEEVTSSPGATPVPVLNTTSDNLVPLFGNETSGSQKSEENSSAEITTVKSSEIAPVKINPLFTETTTVSASDVAVHPENSTVAVDPLFESSSNSSNGLSASTVANVEVTTKTNQTTVTNPEETTTLPPAPVLSTNVTVENRTTESPGTVSNTLTNVASASENTAPNIVGESVAIVSDSSNKSSTVLSASKNGDSKSALENTGSATQHAVETSCSENCQKSVSIVNAPNQPVKIDPLFAENATVSSVAVANPENPTIHVSVDNLFETNSSTSNISSPSITTPLSTSVPEATPSSSLPESHLVETSSSASEVHNSTNGPENSFATAAGAPELKPPGLSTISDTQTNASHAEISSSIPESKSGISAAISENSTEENSGKPSQANISIANVTTSGNSTENKTSESQFSISPENTGNTPTDIGVNVVTDKPTVILDEPKNNASTEQPLFGNAESTTIIALDKSSSFHPETIVVTEVSVSSQTSIFIPNISSTERPEDILETPGTADTIKEGNSKGSEIPVEEMSCDTTTQSTVSFIHGQSASEAGTPEIHNEMETATTISVLENNSHRISVGESSEKEQNENSDSSISTSHMHNAEVSEVKNDDGTTSIVLKAKIKIKINLEDESSHLVDAPSPIRIQTTEFHETTEKAEEPEEPAGTSHLLQSESINGECIFQDTERYLRNIKGTAFSMLNGAPTLLSFVSGAQSHCVGTLLKNGTRGMHDIQRILPGFPLDTEVDAAGFLNDRLYVVDSSKEQSVWSFDYDFSTRTYSEVSMRQSLASTKQELFQLCQINEMQLASDLRIKAFAQVSLHDNSCILFDESRSPILSENASEEAQSLAKAISFLLETEFINYVEAVFEWLDESFISSTYVYGSNGDLYRLFRNATTEFKWQSGNYELLPYPELPLKP